MTMRALHIEADSFDEDLVRMIYKARQISEYHGRRSWTKVVRLLEDARPLVRADMDKRQREITS
ncbi:hypothetical protein LCGC14_1692740 [marine sediment metagenome]|uniref:Uncharacterized protein n=1 Tax=marine sediment metagenome TaxID=412755 RepID=A0A0F9I7X8_9ZZZZ